MVYSFGARAKISAQNLLAPGGTLGITENKISGAQIYSVPHFNFAYFIRVENSVFYSKSKKRASFFR